MTRAYASIASAFNDDKIQLEHLYHSRILIILPVGLFIYFRDRINIIKLSLDRVRTCTYLTGVL